MRRAVGCWTRGRATLEALWSAFRRGGAVVGPCGGLIGVQVKATPLNDNVCAIYRVQCIAHGHESEWFEAHGDAIRGVADAPTNPQIDVPASVVALAHAAQRA